MVPESVGGDLTVAADAKDPNAFVVKPVKDAKLYVLAKPIAGVVPKKAPKLVVGEAFETRFFAGRYKLHDDGRRSGVLKLEVNEAGEITGTFTSDKDGREYEVQGKAGTPEARDHVLDQVPGDDADVHRVHVHRGRQSHRRDDEDARARGGVLRGADRGIAVGGRGGAPKRKRGCRRQARRSSPSLYAAGSASPRPRSTLGSHHPCKQACPANSGGF